MNNNTVISFYRPDEIKISEYEAIVSNMRADLAKLCNGEFSEEEVRTIVGKLLDEARPLKHRSDMLFWGLDEPDSMPSDARVDFFYTPTYLATAFIIKAALIYPDLLESEETRDRLAKALIGSTARGFSGHGYESVEGKVNAMKIFLAAGTGTFISRYPDLCQEFTDLFYKTMEVIVQSW